MNILLSCNVFFGCYHQHNTDCKYNPYKIDYRIIYKLLKTKMKFITILSCLINLITNICSILISFKCFARKYVTFDEYCFYFFIHLLILSDEQWDEVTSP